MAVVRREFANEALNDFLLFPTLSIKQFSDYMSLFFLVTITHKILQTPPAPVFSAKTKRFLQRLDLMFENKMLFSVVLLVTKKAPCSLKAA